ncbi:MAG: DUF87 domain-containing protein [Epsilonproteobacteria bacterium]|nr:DUF87 domain-containing protein [Campylobacterota bacterium]
MQNIYEKMGLFYLGKDSEDEDLTLYKSKDLTTHAMMIGMTGSGKTGLGIGLIEEASIDNIPSIIIDPKGDMGNLCLAFPNLDAEDFAPWMESGKSAKDTADMWKKGLKSSFQDKARVKKFADVEKTIYTPGSSAGVSVNILGSFDAPSKEVLEDSDTLSSLINTTVSSILALMSIDADPLSSKEHILLSNIFYYYYTRETSLSIEDLIGFIASPPFEKVGILPLKSFYPQKERMKLAMKLNGIISSISFSSWIEGEALDIQNMLYDDDGKAKIAIFSIAHLDDSQRMFFVTMLLNAYISWMRKQRGTSSLKSILYMDEVFGFFPPSKNPPSKEPMLLLLKQARAFGTGVVLSTQNPVDIDYKGLSNIGTWFIGKLQTKQDIDKVLDPLSAKSKLSKSEISKQLTTLKGREFFLKNVHREETIKFSTRWVLSYLKGPITKDDIKTLMRDKKQKTKEVKEVQKPKKATKNEDRKPIISQDIKEYFLNTDLNSSSPFYPYIYADVNVRFFNQRRSIDTQENITITLELYDEQTTLQWLDAVPFELDKPNATKPQNASFATLPKIISEAKTLKNAQKSLSNHLYCSKRLELFSVKALKIESSLGQSKRDFMVDIADKLNELKDEKLQKLQDKFEVKYNRLEDKLKRLEIKLQKEQNDVSSKTSDTIVDVGLALFGAFFGRKTSASTLRRGASAFKKSKGVLKEKDDVKNVESLIEDVQNDIEELKTKLEDEIQKIEDTLNVQNYEIKSIFIKPRRSDIIINDIALLWQK